MEKGIYPLDALTVTQYILQHHSFIQFVPNNVITFTAPFYILIMNFNMENLTYPMLSNMHLPHYKALWTPCGSTGVDVCICRRYIYIY